MQTVDVFRAQIDYHYALYGRVWDSIMTLSDAQFTESAPYSLGSIRDHMVHVASVDGRWLRGLQADPAARSFGYEPEDYGTREAVRALWDESERALTDYVAGLSDADLEAVPAGMPGPRWHVLAHIVNHGTDHRAQVLRLLHDQGAPTFDQDLIYHLWPR